MSFMVLGWVFALCGSALRPRFRLVGCFVALVSFPSLGGCETSGSYGYRAASDVVVKQAFRFDCGRFRPPEHAAVSVDGYTLVVLGGCDGSMRATEVSVFSLRERRKPLVSSLVQGDRFLIREPILRRGRHGVHAISFQSNEDSATAEEGFICVQYIPAYGVSSRSLGCWYAGELGGLVGGDVSDDGLTLLAIDSYAGERRVWKIDLDKEAAPIQPLSLRGTEELTSIEAEYLITDAQFRGDDSILFHLRRRASFGSTAYGAWMMVKADLDDASSDAQLILDSGSEISCVFYETLNGAIGNPWSYSNFDGNCAVELITKEAMRPSVVNVLKRPPPDVRGNGIVSASKSNCCLIFYSRQRGLIELVEPSDPDKVQVIDCLKLPRRRCGHVFALDAPGEFAVVHGDIVYVIQVKSEAKGS